MTFEEQLKEAKRKKLENRMMRDAIFIILGVIFLIISILSTYKEKQNNTKENKDNKKITMTISKY